MSTLLPEVLIFATETMEAGQLMEIYTSVIGAHATGDNLFWQ